VPKLTASLKEVNYQLEKQKKMEDRMKERKRWLTK